MASGRALASCCMSASVMSFPENTLGIRMPSLSKWLLRTRLAILTSRVKSLRFGCANFSSDRQHAQTLLLQGSPGPKCAAGGSPSSGRSVDPIPLGFASTTFLVFPLSPTSRVFCCSCCWARMDWAFAAVSSSSSELDSSTSDAT